MKLGIGLPNYLPDEIDGDGLCRWATLADQAGFAMLATLDRPNHHTWDPLVTLAGAAMVTQTIRLATTVLLLPNRNEVMVAKQAAVVDQFSNGRLDLGVGVGSRRDDFDVFDADFENRGQRFPIQVARLKDTWSDGSLPGPNPVQEPHPPLWIGAVTPRTIRRAVDIGDGLIISGGNDLLAGLPDLVEQVRQHAVEAGKPDFGIWRLVYVLVETGSTTQQRDRSLDNLERFYGKSAWTDVANMIHIGPQESIIELVAKHRLSGLDALVLAPGIADSEQLDSLAEHL